MCQECNDQLEAMGVNPNNLLAQMGMAMEADLKQRESMTERALRLACLNLAVKVKGQQGDSRVVISSAHSYYNFVTGNNTDD